MNMTDEEKIIEALIFIEWNLKENINVPLIAKEAGLPVKSFLKLFRQVTGLGTEKYIRKRRLTEVSKQLSSGKETDVMKLLNMYHLNNNLPLIPFLSRIFMDVARVLLFYFPIQESIVNYIIEEMHISCDISIEPLKK